MAYDSLRRLRPLLARLPGIANLVLVVAIGVCGARLFWLVWPIEASATPVVSADSTAEVTRAEVDMAGITGVALFGQAPPDAGQSQSDEVINAPETQLDLTLTGIVSSDGAAARSRALIQKDRGEQQAYAVGDAIADNVNLHEIHATRVILDRNGRFETLTLERLKEQGQVRKVSDGSASDNDSLPDDIGQQLSSVRNEILQQPSRITKYMRLQPEKQNGDLIGYRIYPGRDRSLFQELGLRPGELVTKVNGTSLTNPQQAMQSLNELAQAPRISVTLKRGNSQRTMDVDFE